MQSRIAVYVAAIALGAGFVSALQSADPNAQDSDSLINTPSESSVDKPHLLADINGINALAIGAHANALRMPIAPHEDFGSPGVASLDTASAQPHMASTYESRINLLRREAASPITAVDAGSRFNDGAASDDSDSDHKHQFQENPQFSPEAIFANKKLAPEVAEFLGHLAQRSRVHKKVDMNRRAALEAGLAEGGAAHVSPNDADSDDNDDIEDMSRAGASMPKKTPLSHFFAQMDAKTKAASWMENDCTALATNITSLYQKMRGNSKATWGTAGPASAAERSEIHTGMFFKHWGGSKTKEAARKLRLGVLSFLATQDAAKVKLHIWTDLDKKSDMIKEMLGPIAHHPELMDAINISTFDPKIEFSKVPATLARETLTEHYKKDTAPEIRSDLYRAVVLYNYGGMWMDADTVLMQNVAPLLGEDWAYLVRGSEGAIGGALLSASKPKSHFTNAYLISVVMHNSAMDEEERQQQKPLLVDVFDNDPAHTTLHVLPPCFLDNEPAHDSADVAVLASAASPGSVFFSKAVAQQYRGVFSAGIQEAAQDNSTADVSVLQEMLGTGSQHQDDDDDDDDDEKNKAAPTAPTWAYHWQGNFAAPWARGSLADVAERTFMKKIFDRSLSGSV